MRVENHIIYSKNTALDAKAEDSIANLKTKEKKENHTNQNQSSEAVKMTISEEGKKLASEKYSNLRIMRINDKIYH